MLYSYTSTGNKFATLFSRISGGLALVMLWVVLMGSAYAQPEEELLLAEPPIVQRLLKRAAYFERRQASSRDVEALLRLYCAASSLGSLEAQYRLGKMLFEGRGVRRNLDRAATLFSLASGNGHVGAQAMLQRTGLRQINYPDCMDSPESAS